MAHGGKRPNAGRKTLTSELSSKELAQSAIIAKFGTINKGLEFMLTTGEPSLIKFVFEHAIGRPIERTVSTDTHGNDLAPQIIINQVKALCNEPNKPE